MTIPPYQRRPTTEHNTLKHSLGVHECRHSKLFKVLKTADILEGFHCRDVLVRLNPAERHENISQSLAGATLMERTVSPALNYLCGISSPLNHASPRLNARKLLNRGRSYVNPPLLVPVQEHPDGTVILNVQL